MSMKITYRLRNGSEITFDAETVKGIFYGISQISELLDVEPCQHCGSEHVALRYRAVQQGAYKYYSWICRACQWELPMHQSKDEKSLYRVAGEAWRPPFQSGDDVPTIQVQPQAPAPPPPHQRATEPVPFGAPRSHSPSPAGPSKVPQWQQNAPIPQDDIPF